MTTAIVFLRKKRWRSPEISNQVFRANYMNVFLNDLSCCQIQPGAGSLSRYTYSQKLVAERNYCQLLWNVFKMQKIISRTRGFGWISGNLAVQSILKFTAFSKFKTKNRFNRQVQNVTGSESKYLQLPETIRGRCIRTDPNWNTLTVTAVGSVKHCIRWHCHANPLQSICKSVYFKTETDKTFKVLLNADSFS